MCLLLTQDLGQNTTITKPIFDKIWNQNPHGCGVGYFRGAEPVILTTMERETGWNMYLHAADEAMANRNLANPQPQKLLLHCRYCTHGSKTKSNVHPFFAPIKNGIIVAHNGQTKHEGVNQPYGWSDTRTFAEIWLPRFAENVLTDENDVKKVKEQMGASRLALLTPWTCRTLNFPEQDKEEYRKYGSFSNFIFDPVYKPTRTPLYSQTKSYKPNEQQNKEDKEKWSKTDNIYKYLSPNMIHRLMTYCVKSNMSFAGTCLMFVRLFKDFPSHKQIMDFVEVFEEALEAISDWHEEKRLKAPNEVCDHEHPENAMELLDVWMEYNDIKVKEETVELTEQEKIELAKALAEEQEIADRAIDKLMEEEKNYSIDDDFKNSKKEPKRLTNGNQAFQD